jgi:hypothetical protein
MRSKEVQRALDARCEELGLPPGSLDGPEMASARVRCIHLAACEALGIDPDPSTPTKEDRLRDLEWKIHALGPERPGQIHAWGRVILEEGQEAADRVATEQQAERASVFAEYEALAGHPHPDAEQK